MGAPVRAGASAPCWLTAPASGYRVWFQLDLGTDVWFQRWYQSLAAAKRGRTCMRAAGAVIVGADGTVI